MAQKVVVSISLDMGRDGDIHFYGRPGGIVSTPLDISRIISSHYLRKRL